MRWFSQQTDRRRLLCNSGIKLCSSAPGAWQHGGVMHTPQTGVTAPWQQDESNPNSCLVVRPVQRPLLSAKSWIKRWHFLQELLWPIFCGKGFHYWRAIRNICESVGKKINRNLAYESKLEDSFARFYKKVHAWAECGHGPVLEPQHKAQQRRLGNGPASFSCWDIQTGLCWGHFKENALWLKPETIIQTWMVAEHNGRLALQRIRTNLVTKPPPINKSSPQIGWTLSGHFFADRLLSVRYSAHLFYASDHTLAADALTLWCNHRENATACTAVMEQSVLNDRPFHPD